VNGIGASGMLAVSLSQAHDAWQGVLVCAIPTVTFWIWQMLDAKSFFEPRSRKRWNPFTVAVCLLGIPVVIVIGLLLFSKPN